MICEKISYRHFRNIENATVNFGDGINILYGNNAEGKTNALEGIYLFAQGRSFRAGKEKELIGFGEHSASLELTFKDRERTHVLDIRYSEEYKKQCRRDGVDIRKMSEFIGYFRAVLFCPSHLSIVKDGPAVRRSFIDMAISQIKPFYIISLQNYNKILAQRNALLKTEPMDKKGYYNTLEILSAQLSREASVIAEERREYIKELDVHVRDFFTDMTKEREKTKLLYKTQVQNSGDYQKEFFKMLTGDIEKERTVGSTLYGIHKDDIMIFLNGHSAKSFASQGQQRSIALALKLAEGELSKQETGEYPVFLFDDILSELDINRKKYLLSGLGNRQVIITACEGDYFKDIEVANRIYVEKGNYEAD